MKLTINTLVAGFVILLMLPACSEQRFAFRKTIRVNDETISRINPSSETISILPASELGSKNQPVATGTQKAKSSITVRSVQTKNGTIQTDYITKSLEPKKTYRKRKNCPKKVVAKCQKTNCNWPYIIIGRYRIGHLIRIRRLLAIYYRRCNSDYRYHLIIT